MRRRLLCSDVPAALLTLVLLVGGCVCNKKYKAKAKETDELKAKLDEKDKELVDLNKKVTDLNADVKKLTDEKAALADKSKKDAALRLKATQEETKNLEELRKEADAQKTLLKDLTGHLSSLIGAGKLSLTLVHGRMVLKLKSEVLFASGKANLRDAGKTTLESIAAALKKVKGRHFQVAGHTDNQPIKKADFASNWELSAARAVEVVRFLQSQGVPPSSLSAAGFSEYQPVARNKSGWGRQRNRRIEITLLPSIPSQLLEKAKELKDKKKKKK